MSFLKGDFAICRVIMGREIRNEVKLMAMEDVPQPGDVLEVEYVERCECGEHDNLFFVGRVWGYPDKWFIQEKADFDLTPLLQECFKH